MHIILTHEHADFDAIASLFAAWRLYPEAIPIIPHDVNQNVRDFLTLYWDELPFVAFKQRPRGQVEQIMVVDSQYIPQIRGRTKETRLRVIDHHDLSNNLPPQAEATLVKTGAVATYLVEQIVAANLKISPIQATLMLLGIYEDCGSLTYSNTTPRDVRAVAWLLEQGGKLDVVREFFNYALNLTQKTLYHLLLTALQTHTIKGHQILISAVQSEDHVAEISILAHRFRDLYNPEAIFLLVGFDSSHNKYVQLIARSTNDAIHVGQVAEHFGGGGHPRAAAAHITAGDLIEIHDNLLAVLEEVIQPAVKVREIMSFGVRSVTADEPIRHAAEAMARYGHEGYPVVDGKQIVGILTRREVDKALHHGLEGASIKQFMQAGQIYISPDDTVENLQALMLRERIGQIPVVEDGEMIGIVTRTDLINLWGHKDDEGSEVMNFATALGEVLPPTLLQLLTEAGEQAANIDSSLYIVGGFVRDLLLGVPGGDIDLVVEGDAINLAKAMERQYGGRVRSHKRFGTANWITEGCVEGVDRLDFVTARTEFYRHPTALPEVEQSSIKLDLHRRDFTINTLALRLDPAGFGDLLDFYGGYRDLKNSHIRVLHSLSFVEDPTRILRAIRLEQRLGFHIGERTMEHLQNARDLLERVTAERIFAELTYTFKEAKPEKALSRLDNLGILQIIHPDLQAGNWFAAAARRLRTGLGNTPWASQAPTVTHYLGLLTFLVPAKRLRQVIHHLRIASALERVLHHIQGIKTKRTQLQQTKKPSEVYNLLHTYRDEACLVCWVAFADNPILQLKLATFARNRDKVKPLIDGNYLMKTFNLRPSPRVGDLLTMLRNARIDGKVKTIEEEHQLVVGLLGAEAALNPNQKSV